MDLLSVYSEVTEIITMVSGGDNGTQVSSLSLKFCHIPSSLFWPMPTSLRICSQWRLSHGCHFQHSHGCKETEGGMMKVKHGSLNEWRALMHVISFCGFCTEDFGSITEQ